MHSTKLIVRILSVIAIALFTACAKNPSMEGKFFFGEQPVKVSQLKRGYVYAFLAEDWARFDKYAIDAQDPFSEMVRPIYWYLVVTPPFPTNWPPQKVRSMTYYAYAEYEVSYLHGPTYSRTAPWVKVLLNEGKPANKVILATTLGPTIHGEGSVSISKQSADRKTQIINDGNAKLASFVSWTEIPHDSSEVKIIQEYYCQWALTDRTVDIIKNNHAAFFEWLSCPKRTNYPVLP